MAYNGISDNTGAVLLKVFEKNRALEVVKLDHSEISIPMREQISECCELNRINKQNKQIQKEKKSAS